MVQWLHIYLIYEVTLLIIRLPLWLHGESLQYRLDSLCCTLHPQDYFVTTNLYSFIPSPFPPSAPEPPSLWQSAVHSLYLWVLVLFVHFFCSLDSAYEITWYLSLSVWLISIPCRSMSFHMVKVHFFKQLSDIPLWVCTITSLSNRLLLGPQAASVSWLL